MLDTRDLIPFQVFRRGYSFRKRLVKKCLICHAPKKFGNKEIFNLPMLHIASHFYVFSRIFQSFLTLSKQQLLHCFLLFFEGGFLDKKPHKCNINTRNTYEDHICNLSELTYNQAQIQIIESTTQNFTKFLE